MPRLIKYMIALFVLVCIAFAVFFLSRSPVAVGFAGPLTGPYSDLGVHGRNGVRLAVEEINARGGINGRRLELEVRDDKGTVDGAKEATAGLIESGVVAVIGHMTSQQSMSALPVATEMDTVLLSPTTSTPELTGIKDNFFRVHPGIDRSARALALFASEERSKNQLCTIIDMDNEYYTGSYKNHFVQEFKSRGGKVLYKKEIRSSSRPDWHYIVQDLLKCSSKGFFMSLSARDTASLVQAVQAIGVTAELFSSGWAMTGELQRVGGRTVEGMVFSSSTFQEEPRPAFQTFQEHYRGRFGEKPSFAAAFAYDATQVLALALKKTGGRKSGLKKALTGIQDYPGLYWPISIDKYGDVTSPQYIIQIQNGKFQTVQKLESQELR